ncbi:hypothetical protein JCM5350_000577 [Sporobolomyces pararoseus]
MPVPSLPNELIDQILRYECLEDDDLIQACLVSKSWLEPARKSLWSELWIDVIEQEEDSIDGNPYPRRANYRMRSVCWKLVAVLELQPELASFVKLIGFEAYGPPAVTSYSVSGISTSIPDLISSLLRLCPSATSFSFGHDEWLDREYLSSYEPHFDRLKEVEIEDCSGSWWFEFITKLPNLRSLSLAGRPRLPSWAIHSTVSGIQEIHLGASCDVQAFEILSIGSRSSLRSLTVPLNLLAVVDLSQYPNLRRLGLNECGDAPSYNAIQWFLERLESSGLDTLHFSAEATQQLYKVSNLRSHIPSSCRRINLDGAWTLDVVVSLIHRPEQDEAGVQIAQLGVPEPFVNGEAGGYMETAVVGLKAIVEYAGVELVWIDS